MHSIPQQQLLLPRPATRSPSPLLPLLSLLLPLLPPPCLPSPSQPPLCCGRRPLRLCLIHSAHSRPPSLPPRRPCCRQRCQTSRSTRPAPPEARLPSHHRRTQPVPCRRCPVRHRLHLHRCHRPRPPPRLHCRPLLLPVIRTSTALPPFRPPPPCSRLMHRR